MRRLIAGLTLAAGLVGAGASLAADNPRFVLVGACYCRAGEELRCSEGLTERDCHRRCDEDLCDRWFWLERRPCWNWGYGG
ncbi:MAG TPA: hypothetical protein VFL90_16035 [Methylomirabilota bacterium]|nr:hypothetical protein [Methylomirabilota bacterium]